MRSLSSLKLTRQVKLSGWQAPGIHLTLILQHATMSSFLCGFWALNMHPHAGKESTVGSKQLFLWSWNLNFNINTVEVAFQLQKKKKIDLR